MNHPVHWIRTVAVRVIATILCAPLPQAHAGEALRVCAAADELPYSDRAGKGFENRLAERLAGLLGRPLELVYSDKPGIYHVHEMLNEKRCDVIIGLDTADPRVLTTRPYYRASYFFVTRREGGPDISDWHSAAWENIGNVAFAQGSPAENMLRALGIYDRNLGYMYSLIGFKPKRHQYVRFEPSKMIAEVASGAADVAIVWGPEAARYVSESSVPLEMRPVPDGEWQGSPVVFQYDQSMAVRMGDGELRDALDAVIDRHGDALRAVLADEGIPLAEFASRVASRH